MSSKSQGNTDPEDPLYTPAEAAEYLRFSTSAIYQMVNRRAILHSKIGGKLLIRRSVLDGMVKAGQRACVRPGGK